MFIIVYYQALGVKLNCLFVSDLHGDIKKYQKLFEIVKKEEPDGVFFGGDLLPNQFSTDRSVQNFVKDVIFKKISNIKSNAKKDIRFFFILGNDDPRAFEKYFIDADSKKIIDYVCEKTVNFGDLYVTGYPYVPPTPFQLKDWERYDVSRFVDVGVISPEEGLRTVDIALDEIKYNYISTDLKKLSKNAPVEKTIFLFHSPPYNSNLDRAALDGKNVDHAPVDVHIGSIAITQFIEKRQPFLTLHGHVHESYSLTKKWSEKKGKTYCYSAANHDSDLVIIRFNTKDLEKSIRSVVKI